MSDKKSTADEIEDKIKKAAKEVSDLADKVTADEEPNVVESNPDAVPPNTKGGPKEGS